MRIAILILIVAAAGCTDTTPEWELAHDRVIAVRATPPTAAPGTRVDLDVLVTSIEGGPAVADPLQVAAAPNGPPGFEGAIVQDEDGWGVMAPDAATIEAARLALDLEAGAPVPLALGVGVVSGDAELAAIKTVYFDDEEVPNPELGEVTVAGEPAQDDMVLPIGEEIELVIDADEVNERIDWMTSVGELSDIDDPVGHLEAEEAEEGWLAVVRRDLVGGVVWGYWAVSAQ